MKLILMILGSIGWVLFKWPVMIAFQLLAIVFGFLWRFRTSDIPLLRKADMGFTINREAWNIVMDANGKVDGLRQSEFIDYYANPIDWFKGKKSQIKRSEYES